MERTRKCPFCGERLRHYDINYNNLMSQFVLTHHCEKPGMDLMSIFFTGDKKEDVLEAWGYEDEESESL